ncbi:MAG: hypothetical protein QOG65_1150, partial [Actinomycetota bacterium]|nr:hypothetical protein [Actinomycetota bacterium]
MLPSTMQEFPLTITAVLRHGRTVYGDAECVTWTENGPRRATYATIADNAGRAAGALARLGVTGGDRVGTFMWNSQEHMEVYLAIPSMGAVVHTLNIRLFPEQLAYVINHGEDKVIIVDDSLVPLLAKIASDLTSVECFVIVGDGDAAALGTDRPVARYSELLAQESSEFAWPDIDEHQAAAM